MKNSIRIGLMTSAAIIIIKTLNTVVVYHYFSFDKYLTAVAIAFFLAGYFFAVRKSHETSLSPAFGLPRNGLDDEISFEQLRKIRYSLTSREITIFRFIA